MVLCQKCKQKPAAVCISQVVNFHKVDIYLCKDCANEAGISTAGSPAGSASAASSITGGAAPAFWQSATGTAGTTGTSGATGAAGAASATGATAAALARCDNCGKSFAEIQKDGKLGCARCYTVFRAQLMPIIDRIHRNSAHKGRSPIRARAGQEAERRLEGLREQLAAAIREEEYERAAVLRDEIKALEQREAKSEQCDAKDEQREATTDNAIGEGGAVHAD